MKALLVIDLQIDFASTGTLPVYGCEKIIPGVNALMEEFSQAKQLVVASKDWHPYNHISFAQFHRDHKPYDEIEYKGKQEVIWPIHCVQNEPGADFLPDLSQRFIKKVFYKGKDPQVLSHYSSFYDNIESNTSELDLYLKDHQVEELYIVGIATDFCVNATVLDACKLNYKTYVYQDLIHGTDNSKKTLNKIFTNWKSKGATIISSNEKN